MKHVIFISIFFIQYLTSYSQKDSSFKKHFKLPNTFTYSNNLSASYVAYKNWKYVGNNNFVFLIRENINYDTIGNQWETHVRFNGELGYMKFVDSVWYKNSDYLDFSIEVIKMRNKKLMNVFTCNINSQFLSSYETSVNDSGLITRRWVAGFGNPMCLDLCLGSSIKFWKTSRINFNYATLRTSINPLPIENIQASELNFTYKKSIITSEYGLSIQTFVRHNFTSRIRFENYSRFFANAINPNHINIDFRNKIIVKILKYLDLILDSRIRYTPNPPYKFQFRNELMLSFTLEKY